MTRVVVSPPRPEIALVFIYLPKGEVSRGFFTTNCMAKLLVFVVTLVYVHQLIWV
jgi:hypothetical protein